MRPPREVPDPGPCEMIAEIESKLGFERERERVC